MGVDNLDRTNWATAGVRDTVMVMLRVTVRVSVTVCCVCVLF